MKLRDLWKKRAPVDEEEWRNERRSIEIPPELEGDALAIARHVVSTRDVVLLVDGDHVASTGWPGDSLAKRRNALVVHLAELAKSTHVDADVVFDGRVGDDDSLPISRTVRIRLSTPPTLPSAALDELVDAYPFQWPIALATDDPELAASATERNAVVLGADVLLELLSE